MSCCCYIQLLRHLGVNFKLHFLATFNEIMLILTPLYLRNRGIKWVWKWSQIWVSTTGSMIFIACKFLIFAQGCQDFWRARKASFLCDNRGTKLGIRCYPFIILTSDFQIPQIWLFRVFGESHWLFCNPTSKSGRKSHYQMKSPMLLCGVPALGVQ